MTTQIRSYAIKPGHMEDFVAAWGAGVPSLRARFGFTVEGAWVLADENRFVWILTYDGPGDWEEAEEAYYSSDERKAMYPDPSRWVVEPDAWFADRVL